MEHSDYKLREVETRAAQAVRGVLQKEKAQGAETSEIC